MLQPHDPEGRVEWRCVVTHVCFRYNLLNTCYFLWFVSSQAGSYDGMSLLQVGRVDSLESEGESSLNRVNSVSDPVLRHGRFTSPCHLHSNALDLILYYFYRTVCALIVLVES